MGEGGHCTLRETHTKICSKNTSQYYYKATRMDKTTHENATLPQVQQWLSLSPSRVGSFGGSLLRHNTCHVTGLARQFGHCHTGRDPHRSCRLHLPGDNRRTYVRQAAATNQCLISASHARALGQPRQPSDTDGAWWTSCPAVQSTLTTL